jgi:hypothetical protein
MKLRRPVGIRFAGSGQTGDLKKPVYGSTEETAASVGGLPLPLQRVACLVFHCARPTRAF